MRCSRLPALVALTLAPALAQDPPPPEPVWHWDTAVPFLQRALRLGAGGDVAKSAKLGAGVRLEVVEASDEVPWDEVCVKRGSGIPRTHLGLLVADFAPADVDLVLCADLHIDRFLGNVFDAAGPRFRSRLEGALSKGARWESEEQLIEELGGAVGDRVLVLVRRNDDVADPVRDPPNDGRLTDAWCVVLPIRARDGATEVVEGVRDWIGLNPQKWGLRGRDNTETGYWKNKVAGASIREFWIPDVPGTGHLCCAVRDGYVIVANSTPLMGRVLRVNTDGDVESLLERESFRSVVAEGPESAGAFLWAGTDLLDDLRRELAHGVSELVGTGPNAPSTGPLLERDLYRKARTGLLLSWRVEEDQVRLRLNGLNPD